MIYPINDENKPTLRFSLTVNSQENEGFKLSVMASGEKELAIVKELTDKLIEKIEKISIEVKNTQYE